MLAASDVAGQGDTPLADQLVLAVAAEEVERIFGAGSQARTDAELRFLKALLAAADPAIVHTMSDAAGQFVLPLDPGAYLVCVADPEQPPASFPATTRGCGRAEVRPGVLHSLDISSGFGEILLVER